jgi:hypothetical protein
MIRLAGSRNASVGPSRPLFPALGFIAPVLVQKEVEIPRFYFAIQGLSVTEDLGQIDLPNRAAAHDKALKAARAYRAAMSRENIDPMQFAIVVFDQWHRVVEVVFFREA